MVTMNQGTQLEELLPFITTITRDARERGCNVMLLPAEEGIESAQRLVSQAIVDAIIMFDIKRHDSRIRSMSELGIPVVLVGNPEDPAMLHCVDVDYSQVAHLAADELVRTGASRVVAVSDFVDKQDFTRRDTTPAADD